MRAIAMSLRVFMIFFWFGFIPRAEVQAQAGTLSIKPVRELYGIRADLDAPIGKPVSHFVFRVQCQGALSMTISFSHSDPQFVTVGSEVMVLNCASIYNIEVRFTPKQTGISTDTVTFSGPFGTLTTELIGNGVAIETPPFWVSDLGEGSSGVRLVYDDQRGLVYITDPGNDTVIVFSPQERRVIQTIRVGPDPVGLALSVDHQKLYVANTGEPSVSVIDLQQMSETEILWFPDLPLLSNGQPNPPYDIAAVSGTTLLLGLEMPGAPIYQIDLAAQQLIPRQGTLVDHPVFRTSWDHSTVGIVMGPAYSPTRLARYDTKSNTFVEQSFRMENTIAINPDGSRIVTSNHDCNQVEPNLALFDRNLIRRSNLQLLGCQSLSLVFNPMAPEYLYAVDGSESGQVDVARVDLGIQTQMLTFDTPDGYYQADSHAMTISGDGDWLYMLLVQTFSEPPSKLLAVFVGSNGPGPIFLPLITQRNAFD